MGGRVTAWWAAAVAAGEVGPGIYNPPNRRNNRPDHAFRAAFMGYFEDLVGDVPGIGPVQIIDDKTVDYLVGHAPSTVRDRSYKKPKASRLRAAVDSLPPIDVGADVMNVVPLRR